MQLEKSVALFNKGQKHLVGAVNSPVRAFKSVGGVPVFIERAKGSKIYDVDGNEYIDLVLSYGPMILGHRHPRVERSIKKALKKGYTFGASTNKEIRLAKMVCNAFPGMDKVRFVNSGTEAVLSAIRLARAFTGHNKIIKFSGCYHGHSDALLVAAGSGLATLSLPGSKGVPDDAVKNTLIAEYNNLESVKVQIEAHPDIAAVILEPIAGNMGVVEPAPEFIQELRVLTKKHDILLIVDEVMTGFRVARGGAQELYGIAPDLTTLGKVIGGGLPVGAFGGRADIMSHIAPEGNVYQAGTLSGNPLACVAGLTMLRALTDEVYSAIRDKTDYLAAGLKKAAEAAGVPVCVNHVCGMFGLFFTAGPVSQFDHAANANIEQFNRFFHAMLDAGVYLAPSAFEAGFVSAAHTHDDLDATLRAAASAFKTL